MLDNRVAGSDPLTWGHRKEAVRMRRAFLFLSAVALFAMLSVGVASAAPKGPGSFALHLSCENGSEFDLTIPVGDSYAALVNSSNSVAVLKGQDLDFDGTPDVLVRGFSVDELVACDTTLDGQLIFVAYVLFTPANAG
jgi:hypothetical protein